MATSYPQLEQKIKEYFGDFFTDMQFYEGNVNSRRAFGFGGMRGGNKFEYSDNSDNWYAPDEMLYHFLENIKGDIVRQEQQMILEK